MKQPPAFTRKALPTEEHTTGHSGPHKILIRLKACPSWGTWVYVMSTKMKLSKFPDLPYPVLLPPPDIFFLHHIIWHQLLPSFSTWFSMICPPPLSYNTSLHHPNFLSFFFYNLIVISPCSLNPRPLFSKTAWPVCFVYTRLVQGAFGWLKIMYVSQR